MRGLGAALTSLGLDLGTIVVILVAVPLVNSGDLDGVYLAVLVLTVAAAFEAVAPLPQAYQNLERSVTAAQRLFDIIDAEPHVLDPNRPLQLAQPLPLVVRNLSFSYPSSPATQVLCDISLDLRSGRTVALVGPNGAGKSTLLHLLLRFWDYQAGAMQLAGKDVRNLESDHVRDCIAVVSQTTYLFAGTLSDNLRIARPAATDEQIVDATRAARLHKFIVSLPEGYDTWIGELGARLSGGQRQRLAIARALLKDAPLLFLDEPTANLDAITAAEIQRELQRVAGNRSTLLVTHKLTGLEWVDEALVMVDGRIVERGTVEELKRMEGTFRRMYELQIGELDAVTEPTA